MAIAAPPSILPSTIDQRGTGATSTPCKKPFLAILDDRDRGEDRREQQNHHQRAGKEMGVVEPIRTAERASSPSPR